MSAVDAVRAAAQEHPRSDLRWLVGSPGFGPPPELREALSREARQGSFDYSPLAGIPEFRELLSHRMREEGVVAGPDEILVTHGAKGGLLAIIAALLEPGDEILHPIPAYPAYRAMAEQLGARAIGVPHETDDFAGWTDSVREQITSRTRLIVLSSPANPDGAVLAAEERTRLLDLCRAHDLHLVLDEAYEAFRFSPAEPAEPTLDHLIRVRSFSKSHALCGLRIGWVVAERGLIAAATRRQATLLNPPNLLGQRGLLSLPHVPATWGEDVRVRIRTRLDLAVARLRAGGAAVASPAGGFYLWFDPRPAPDSRSPGGWCVDFAREQGIALWPGEDYGAIGRVRLAVASGSEADFANGLDRLCKAREEFLERPRRGSAS